MKFQHYPQRADCHRRVTKCGPIRDLRTCRLSSRELLKLDCEGSEFEILVRFPSQELQKIRHFVAEIHARNEPGYNAEALSQHLGSHGFQTRVELVKDGPVYLYASNSGWLGASR